MIEKDDTALLSKIIDQDLVAREAHYRSSCRRNYTRLEPRHTRHEGSDAHKITSAHNEAFDFSIQCVDDQIIEEQNVKRLTMLNERYLTYLHENIVLHKTKVSRPINSKTNFSNTLKIR